ncbi:hypothetical protein SAMN05216558_2997 [Pseudomonas vancouverensis]|uniref:Uncharacterized protein n=1 Tax=Pseudomonas vancouverensis TaxID=95300 RepID=A0A1H2NUE5_PSEVA|nr:hypothetical protein F7R09_11305 [Pseudomonas vancouverensis]TDB64962.1 hypothetical protein EIY72_11130 [Pseudomonas vancouverensis]SDV09033.1 hypothetical protein SAMN05216558_2997 [Pseudomonas vancouverensis]
MLAMVVNDDVGCPVTRGVAKFIASMLAPTGGNVFRQVAQGLLGMPYLRRRMAIALWDVCNRAASKRLDG